jgi:hypothetical protein
MALDSAAAAAPDTALIPTLDRLAQGLQQGDHSLLPLW